jgi:autotransporter adhesin
LAAQDQRVSTNRTDIDQLRSDVDNFDPDLDGVVKFSADRLLVDMKGASVAGVAAGDISSETSTDAVNGGQLFATNSRIGALELKDRLVDFGKELGAMEAESGLFGVALGNGAQASLRTEGGTAVGSYSTASGKNSVALGRGSLVEEIAEAGFALGAGASVAQDHGVALGSYSEVRAGAFNSVALGANSIVGEERVVSIGSPTLKRRLTNVARGTSGDNAATIAQLNEALAGLGGGAGLDAFGNVVGPAYSVQGGKQNNVGDALAALDGAVVRADRRADGLEGQLRATFQQSPSTRADGVGQLNLAGAQGMVLSNLADGRIAAGSREAVNGGQLHAVQQQLNGRMDGLEQRVDGKPQARAMATASADAGAPTPTPTSSESAAATPPVANDGDKAVADSGSAPSSSPTPQPKSKKDDAPAPTPQVDTAELEKMLARANEYTDGAIKGVEQRLDKMDKRFNRMAAMSSAQTAMAMNTAGLATYNRLGAGVGYAEGESAMAVGYQRVLNDKGSATFSLNGAFTNSGEQSVGLGVGIGW